MAARADAIRARVLRGIALNRTPGLHFPGNFLDVSFDRVAREGSRLAIAPGPWCTHADGTVDFAAIALLSDLGLAASIRANLARETRLATVSLHLQFTGVPAKGRLRADGEFQGFQRQGAGRLGLTRVSVSGAKGQVCYGTGSFMALLPPKGVTLHPVPHRKFGRPEPAKLAPAALDAQERRILARADAALAARGDFIGGFWGVRARNGRAVLENGPHVGNRVGHAQGGIMVALAAASAGSALPENFRVSGLSAYYISPGDAKILRAASEILHQGRLTAVVRTRITGTARRIVLEVVTTHVAA